MSASAAKSSRIAVCCAGHDGSGHVEFEIDEQAAAEQKKHVEVGAGEARQQTFARGG